VIQDHSDHAWCVKGTDESVTRVDSLVHFMQQDPSDLESLMRIRITPKERTLTKIMLRTLCKSRGIVQGPLTSQPKMNYNITYVYMERNNMREDKLKTFN